MALSHIRVRMLPVIAGALLVVAMTLIVQPAYASNRDELQFNYQSAVLVYESAVSDQERNAEEIEQVESDIVKTQKAIERSREQLGDTASTLYKSKRKNNVLLDLLLSSTSFQDMVMRYETYEKIEDYYYDRIHELVREEEELNEQREELEQRKLEIEQQVTAAKQAVDDAAAALLDNMHTDGANFHQLQGVGNNCGATAFIVAVNTLLHENRYTDNVAVWNGPGFDGCSTSDLAYRGGVWLVANGLSGLISIEQLPGDIHTVEQMREQLEQGYVVVTSSGSGSTWCYADGSHVPGAFPDGHWITFYCYEDGVFYANDSSTTAARGAGCRYTEADMQQWLDGRGNHFATVLKKL